MTRDAAATDGLAGGEPGDLGAYCRAVEHYLCRRNDGHLVRVADADYMTVNSPIEIRGQQKVRPRRAPQVGEHSEQVLREAGYGEAEIAALREAGVIG